jgi:hypothetical protein
MMAGPYITAPRGKTDWHEDVNDAFNVYVSNDIDRVETKSDDGDTALDNKYTNEVNRLDTKINNNTLLIGQVESGAFSAFQDETNPVVKISSNQIRVAGVDVTSEYQSRRSILPNGLQSEFRYVKSSTFDGTNTFITTTEDLGVATVTSLKKGILVPAVPQERLVAKPINTSPTNGETDIFPIILTGSPYRSLYGRDRLRRIARVATDPDMINVVSTAELNADSIEIDFNDLEVDTLYYFDLQDEDIYGNLSERSLSTSFTTSDTFNAWSHYDGTLNGVETAINSVLTHYCSIAMADDTNAVLFYRDNSTTGYGEIVPISRTSGSNTWTASSPVVINSVSTAYCSIAMADDTHAVLFYRNEASGLGEIIPISRTAGSNTWSASSPVVINSVTTLFCSIAMADDTHAVLFYRNGTTGYGEIVPISRTSGSNTWTAGSPIAVTSTGTLYCSIAMADDTHAVLFYRNERTDYGEIVPISRTAGSNTWSASSPVVINSVTTLYCSIAMADDTHAVLFYRNERTDYGEIIPISRTAGSNTWSASSPVVINSVDTAYCSIAMADDTNAVLFYENNSSGRGEIIPISRTAGSNTWSASSPVAINSVETLYCSIARADDTNAVVFYRNESNLGFGTIIPIVAR